MSFFPLGTNTLCLDRLRLRNTSPQCESWYLQGIELKKVQSALLRAWMLYIWLEATLLQTEKEYFTESRKNREWFATILFNV